MIKIDKCCCCCSVRTGSIILGVLILIGGVFYASTAVFGLSGEENMDAATFEIFNITDIDVQTDGTEEDGDDKEIVGLQKLLDDMKTDVTKNQVIAYLVVQLIVGLLDIFSVSILFLGISQSKPGLVIPILITIPVTFAVNIITELAIVGFTWYIFPNLLMTLLWVYFWVCLFSFWQEQKEEMKYRILNIEFLIVNNHLEYYSG